MATKYPPRLSLSEAIRVIKDIYKLHKSNEISLDLMPEILRVSKGSSFFPDKINALQKFGFANKKPNEILALTDLAMQIIKPIGDEDIEAKHIAFRKEEVLSSLIDKYPDGNLPSADQTKQTLIKLFNIPKTTVDKWYQFIIDSFRELNIKRSITVEDNLNISDKPSGNRATVIINASQNLVLPSGKKFSFSLENGAGLIDLEFIIDFFELLKKRVKE